MGDDDVEREVGLASVIVPCFNALPHTRACIAALLRHTRRPWELIVVDDGSTDQTPVYLRGIRDVSPVPVKIVTNTDNLGLPAACNRGIEAARGDFVVLMDSDVVATKGWLDRLAELALADPRIGLVGPMSNYAVAPQLVEDAAYPDLGSMHDFAARWQDSRRGRWASAERLGGFCLLIRWPVLEAIGGLDEQFAPGFFADADLCERARRAGYDLAVAEDLFVHHYGSRTFLGAGIDVASVLRTNRAKFEAKWGVAGAIAVPRAARARNSRISLTMIVGDDEQGNLTACLETAKGLFDEIVVIHTGRDVRSAELARSFGARVFDFVWVDDFAAARNAALARATGDYAFWLDAGDRIDPLEYRRLRSLFEEIATADEAAYSFRCIGSAAGREGAHINQIRLFPVRGDIRWSYPAREQILPALAKAGISVRETGVTIRNVGGADPHLQQQQRDRDTAILRAELADRSDDPFLLSSLVGLMLGGMVPHVAMDRPLGEPSKVQA